MILVSQHYMWPVVMKANAMSSWPIEERLKEIPWMFADLLFPFLVEYLVRKILPLIKIQILMDDSDDMVLNLGVDSEYFGRAHLIF
jgi:hypothetical protein